MEKINVAELLCNCPSGMELDCTMYEDVCFDYVDELNIIHCYIQHETHKTSLTFNQHGTPNSDIKSKCVIFPKGKTTWEGFTRPFEDGDIVVAEDAELFQLFLLKHLTLIEDDNSYDGYCYFGWDFQRNELFEKGNWGFNRLATEEEKEKLFQAIKDNGYKWNEETKTLEKLPKFKDGDIIYTETHISEWISIFEKFDDDECKCYIDYSIDSDTYYGRIGYKNTLCEINDIVEQRLATEEEKQKLFDVIKENGHRWNSETNTLVKLVQPRFKVGDVIQDIDAYKVKITEVNLEDGCYEYESTIAKGIGSIPFIEQDNWELVPDVKPIFKVGDNITKIDGSRKGEIFYIDIDRYHVAVSNDIGIDVFFEDQDDWKLIPNKFDINTLKPFQKVLMRDSDKEYWSINLFGFYNEITKQFHCMGNSNIGWNECIPYEGNEHLLGTTDDCDEYFKI